MAGIHGRESEGSYSIVLSGGYEDDEDEGDEFTYSGSGGRDLSGNKRTAKQSYDQKLTHMNRYSVCVCVCVPLDIIVYVNTGPWLGTVVQLLMIRKELKPNNGEMGNQYEW